MTDFSSSQALYEENFRYAQSFWSPYVEAARVYTRAAAGFTWSDEERQELIKEGREPLELNIMRRPLQFYSGYLRDNLNSIVISGVEGSDDETADDLSFLSSYYWDKGKGYVNFLDGCDEAGKSGIALCGVELSYDKDFINGDPVFYKRTFNSFYLDPVFEQIDLSDCGFALTRDLISRKSAQMLLQYIGDDVAKDVPVGFRDNKFISFHPQFSNFAQNRDIIAYDQHYVRTTRMRKYLIDRKTSFAKDITDFSDEDLDKVETAIYRLRRMKEEGEVSEYDMNLPELEIRKIERPFVRLDVFLNGLQFYSGIDKTGIAERFPFVPIVCYLEPSLWFPQERLQGFPSTMYSMQRQFNKRHMKIVDMMDSEISTGFKYLIGSVPDVKDLLQSGQMKLIGVDPDNAPEGLNSVQELKGGGANPTLIEYQRILDELSLTLANVNETLLGIDQDSKTIISGRLAQVRLAQGLRTNRKFFDNVEYSQQLLGSILLEVIQKNVPVEKATRILGREPTEQFYDGEFEQFDAVIKQGLRSQTQKDAYYNELVNLKREGIVDVAPTEIVKALSITGISSLMKSVEQQEEAAREQQQKINLQEEIAMALENSKKEENLALAESRRARVLGEIGLYKERISESEENRAQAALARAKTITEIASMQDERLLRVIDFVNRLEQEEIADRQMKEAESAEQAGAIMQDMDQSDAEVVQQVRSENADDMMQGQNQI